MPNIFTPNGDIYNPLFRPMKYESVNEYELLIYNRWGQKVYQSNDIEGGWDGEINGKELPEGCYFWLVSYKDIEGLSLLLNGTVTLLR